MVALITSSVIIPFMNHLYKTPGFKKFHLGFWLLAGFALFISGYSQSNFLVSFTRNVYLTLFALALTFLLAVVWQKIPRKKFSRSWLLFLASNYLLGTILIIFINPVTFGQLGVSLEQLTWRHIFAGTMNFSFVVVFWGILFTLLIGKNSSYYSFDWFPGKRLMFGQKPSNAYLTMKEGGQIWFSDLYYLKAAGDYVELHTTRKMYLKTATLNSLLDLLPSENFIQIHRSIIINLAMVKRLEGFSKGSFSVVMKNGTRLKSSRKYKTALEKSLKGLS